MWLAAFTTHIPLATTKKTEVNSHLAEIPAQDNAGVADPTVCVVLEASVKRKELL